MWDLLLEKGIIKPIPWNWEECPEPKIQFPGTIIVIQLEVDLIDTQNVDLWQNLNT